MSAAVTKPGLLRLLGVAFGLAAGVGTIIGAGILRLPAILATHVPDVFWLFVIWILGAIHVVLSANLLAELSTAVPKAGGPYVAAERAFGPIGGLVVGWADWLLYVAGAAALSIAAADFIGTLSPWIAARGGVIAAAIIVLVVGLNLIGVREGRSFQIATSLLKFSMLCGLIVAAVLIAPPDAPRFSGAQPHWAFALAPVLIAYQLIVGAYGGWMAPAYFAEENVNPSRALPRALFTSILAVSAVYILMNVAVLYAVPFERLQTTTLAAADAVRAIPGNWSPGAVAIIAFVSAVGCINGVVMIASRILYGLSRDRIFPAIGARVNRGGTPDAAVIIGGVLALLLTASGTYEAALSVVGFYTVLVSFAVDVSYFALRQREPALERPYRAIGHPVLPAIVLVLDAALLVAFVAVSPRSVAVSLALLALALPIYFLTRRLAAPKA